MERRQMTTKGGEPMSEGDSVSERNFLIILLVGVCLWAGVVAMVLHVSAE